MTQFCCIVFHPLDSVYSSSVDGHATISTFWLLMLLPNDAPVAIHAHGFCVDMRLQFSWVDT